ncbi:MAG: type II toxin-antitoxin system RelE/ParE family toxin [Acidobacteria bacterium]|nr:type II toxin-antitoxin system RelE/ParE family toxin [Acidobacteriota bacterium]MBS1865663.1 type II toxin-antitoxin system RelE/ParE family toxin [Acidobacteriota bacterium]
MAIRAVQFHEEASTDVESAFEWYFARSEWAAARFLQAVDDGIREIAESPDRWPLADFGARKYLVVRFPFAVFYREFSSAIQIIAVAHASRRPGFWRGRL